MSIEQVREIPLTQGRFAIVDIADYDKVSQFKWFALQSRHNQRENRMKMSDIFKLPFVIREIEKDVDGIPTIAYILVEDGGKQSYNTAMLGYEPIGAQWIVNGLNAHDTHLADIGRLLEGSKWSLGILDEIVALDPKILPRLIREALKVAHQTHAELREKYKEKKDESLQN